MQQVLKLLNIKHLLTSAYHAQCDGQAERANKTFINIISHFVSENQKDWDQIVPFAEWCMNTMKQETTGYSPFELVFGRPPLQPIDVALNFEGFEEVEKPSEYAGMVYNWLKAARQVALERVNKTHDAKAHGYNEKRREIEYLPGELVLEWKPVGEEGLATKLLRK